MNLEPNHRFGSPSTLNFELDPGPVLKKFGSNHGSEPNRGNTIAESRVGEYELPGIRVTAGFV